MKRYKCLNMMKYCATSLLFLATVISSVQSVEPNYLDMLLLSQNYEKFAEVTGLDVDLVKPGPGSSDNPMFNKGLKEGDMILTANQSTQGRQNLDFERYPDSKWPGVVPYEISNAFLFYSGRVQAGIDEWNRQFGSCVQWKPRRRERDYVFIFPGNGCYSNVGKVGGMQQLSLQIPGCLRIGTVVHEMEHAVGFSHEHTRGDRDDNLKVLFENIPPQWQSQYEKNDPTVFGVTQKYDYYSVMHYPYEAPDSGGKPAFELPSDVDPKALGQRDGFTELDKAKVRSQYCTNSTQSPVSHT